MITPNISFQELSFVPAPTCEACGREMVGANSYRWACPNLECSKAGEPIHLGGCYPIRPIEEVMKDLTQNLRVPAEVLTTEPSRGYDWLPEDERPKTPSKK